MKTTHSWRPVGRKIGFTNRSGFPQLAAGEIISTGTMTDAAPVAPGQTWSTEFEGGELSGLTVRFE
jgi:2-keto-4-pentenoate hydratase